MSDMVPGELRAGQRRLHGLETVARAFARALIAPRSSRTPITQNPVTQQGWER